MPIKLRRIKNLSISTIVLGVLTFVFMVAGLVTSILSPSLYGSIPLGILALLSLVVSLILTLVDGIIILATDWENPNINRTPKLLWGLLTILLLGATASLIFCSVASSEYKKSAGLDNFNNVCNPPNCPINSPQAPNGPLPVNNQLTNNQQSNNPEPQQNNNPNQQDI